MTDKHYGHEHKADSSKPARIALDFWLIVKRGEKNGYGRKHPKVRVSADAPKMDREERAINLVMSLPIALFETPSITATINVESPRETVEIDVPALTESVRQAIGMDVHIAVREPDGEG